MGGGQTFSCITIYAPKVQSRQNTCPIFCLIIVTKQMNVFGFDLLSGNNLFLGLQVNNPLT